MPGLSGPSGFHRRNPYELRTVFKLVGWKSARVKEMWRLAISLRFTTLFSTLASKVRVVLA